jgi:hypothetical protein
MSIVQRLREMRPYHLLLLTVLAAVVLAQVAAMVLVTRSQVQKAQAHYAQAPSADTAVQPVKSAARMQPPAKDGVVKVGFVVAR